MVGEAGTIVSTGLTREQTESASFARIRQENASTPSPSVVSQQQGGGGGSGEHYVYENERPIKVSDTMYRAIEQGESSRYSLSPTTQPTGYVSQQEQRPEQIALKLKYLQSPTAQWGSKESFDRAVAQVEHRAPPGTQFQGVSVPSKEEQEQHVKQYMAQELAKGQYIADSAKIIRDERDMAIGFEALPVPWISKIPILDELNKREMNRINTSTKDGKLLTPEQAERQRLSNIKDITEARDIKISEFSKDFQKQMFNLSQPLTEVGSKLKTEGLVTKDKPYGEGTSFLRGTALTSVGNLLGFVGTVPGGLETMYKYTTQKPEKLPLVALIGAGMLAEGMWKQATTEPTQFVSDLLIASKVTGKIGSEVGKLSSRTLSPLKDTSVYKAVDTQLIKDKTGYELMTADAKALYKELPTIEAKRIMESSTLLTEYIKDAPLGTPKSIKSVFESSIHGKEIAKPLQEFMTGNPEMILGGSTIGSLYVPKFRGGLGSKDFDLYAKNQAKNVLNIEAIVKKGYPRSSRKPTKYPGFLTTFTKQMGRGASVADVHNFEHYVTTGTPIRSASIRGKQVQYTRGLGKPNVNIEDILGLDPRVNMFQKQSGMFTYLSRKTLTPSELATAKGKRLLQKGETSKKHVQDFLDYAEHFAGTQSKAKPQLAPKIKEQLRIFKEAESTKMYSGLPIDEYGYSLYRSYSKIQGKSKLLGAFTGVGASYYNIKNLPKSEYYLRTKDKQSYYKPIKLKESVYYPSKTELTEGSYYPVTTKIPTYYKPPTKETYGYYYPPEKGIPTYYPPYYPPEKGTPTKIVPEEIKKYTKKETETTEKRFKKFISGEKQKIRQFATSDPMKLLSVDLPKKARRKK